MQHCMLGHWWFGSGGVGSWMSPGRGWKSQSCSPPVHSLRMQTHSHSLPWSAASGFSCPPTNSQTQTWCPIPTHSLWTPPSWIFSRNCSGFPASISCTSCFPLLSLLVTLYSLSFTLSLLFLILYLCFPPLLNSLPTKVSLFLLAIISPSFYFLNSYCLK